MRVLLDEDVPRPAVEVLKHVLRAHQVDHIQGLHWSGKKDKFVYQDAKRRGFDVIVTNDGKQMTDPLECAEVKKAGIHRVSYDQRDGLKGLIDTRHRRYEILDPQRQPPRYWPR